MGVAISSHSALAPISLASTIIGFVSFAVTVATLLRVSWDNLATVAAAPTEIVDMLGNLKSGLYEERRYLRRAVRRKRRRSASIRREKGGDREWKEETTGDRTLFILRDTIKHMLKRFRDLERPFLPPGSEQRRRTTKRLDQEDEAWDTEGPRGYEMEVEDSSYGDESGYRKCGLRERWYWLKNKSDVQNMLGALSRVQTRRIAKETGEMSLAIMHMERDWRHLDERLWAIENRLSRVVGVRRVE
ncbi:MAG: hypothetical protein INR71_02960 [Terriglobus roseus]|nr:hypothetical protein [Terriglobus roseus]